MFDISWTVFWDASWISSEEKSKPNLEKLFNEEHGMAGEKHQDSVPITLACGWECQGQNPDLLMPRTQGTAPLSGPTPPPYPFNWGWFSWAVTYKPISVGPDGKQASLPLARPLLRTVSLSAYFRLFRRLSESILCLFVYRIPVPLWPHIQHCAKCSTCLTSLNPCNHPWARYYYEPHFTEGETHDVMWLNHNHPLSNDRAGILNIQSFCGIKADVTDPISGSRAREKASSGLISGAYSN